MTDEGRAILRRAAAHIALRDMYRPLWPVEWEIRDKTRYLLTYKELNDVSNLICQLLR